jgi:hypothetical protein
VNPNGRFLAKYYEAPGARIVERLIRPAKFSLDMAPSPSPTTNKKRKFLPSGESPMSRPALNHSRNDPGVVEDMDLRGMDVVAVTIRTTALTRLASIFIRPLSLANWNRDVLCVNMTSTKATPKFNHLLGSNNVAC